MKTLFVFAAIFVLVSTEKYEEVRNERHKRDYLKGGMLHGTKWCGSGNTAKNENDVGDGEYRAADLCCRTHDHCPKVVNAAEHAYGIWNKHIFKLPACSCDVKLLKCLKANGNDRTSVTAGETYFDLINVGCFHDNATIDYSLKYSRR